MKLRELEASRSGFPIYVFIVRNTVSINGNFTRKLTKSSRSPFLGDEKHAYSLTGFYFYPHSALKDKKNFGNVAFS